MTSLSAFLVLLTTMALTAPVAARLRVPLPIATTAAGLLREAMTVHRRPQCTFPSIHDGNYASATRPLALEIPAFRSAIRAVGPQDAVQGRWH
jgi:hypothetical protein